MRLSFTSDGACIRDIKPDLSPQEMLADLRRVIIEPLLDSPVDTLVLKMDRDNQYAAFPDDDGQLPYFKHITDDWDTDLIVADFAHCGVQWIVLKKLFDAGLDPHLYLIDEAHKAGLRVLAKIRMNDNHFALRGTNEYMMRTSPLVREHPEFMLGFDCPLHRGRPGQSGAEMEQFCTHLDFGEAMVRASRLELMERTLRRYPFDGFEFNFQRFPHYFRRGELDRGRRLVTEMIARARKMMDEIGRDTGIDRELSIRVLSSIEKCEEIGLDLRRWMNDGLIDVLIAAPSFWGSFMPIKPFVDARRGTKTKIIAGLCGGGCFQGWFTAPNERTRVTPAIIHAMTLNYWNAGVDGFDVWAYDQRQTHRGIYNNPKMLQAVFDAAERRQLPYKDKHYLLVGPEIANHAHAAYPRQVPKPLAIGSTTVELEIGDDVPAAKSEARLSGVELKLRLINLSANDQFDVALNGKTIPTDCYRLLLPTIGWLNIDLTNGPLPSKGINTITINLHQRDADAACDIVLHNVELMIKYG